MSRAALRTATMSGNYDNAAPAARRPHCALVVLPPRRPAVRTSDGLWHRATLPTPRVNGNPVNDQIPVLVVGGGPVGLATALELAAHGAAVTVIETRPAVTWTRPRAKTTSARTMEHLRRWGLAQEIRHRAPLKPTWSDQVVFCTTLLEREVTRFDRCFALDLIDDDLVAEGGQQVPQPLIESVMRRRVEELPATTLLTGRTVTGLRQDADGVTVDVRTADGRSETLRASYVVGCDGARSVVRDAIGVHLDGDDDSRPNYNIVFRSEELAARVPHGNAVQYWVLDPDQPGLVGRLDLDGTWWCIGIGVDAEAGAADPVGLVHRLIGDRKREIPVEVVAADPWRSRMRVADSYRVGRVFLAGDAAHLNPPWGGHGFNTGVGDAVNLGWKLAAVLAGWAPETLLDSYQAERRAVAAHTVEAATRNMATLGPELGDRRLIGTDAEFAEARPLVAEAVHRSKDSEFHSLGLVLGTSYAGSPIVDAGPVREIDEASYVPRAAPGDRLPHTWLGPADSLYDRLGPGYSLVGDLTAPAAARIEDCARRLGIPLTVLAFERAEELFEAPLVIVRPDQHVAWRGTDVEHPEDLWRRLTGHTG
ncbi:FAD-dependent oxidoreductase [Kitasatospora sp. NE20-6]|uniref:FAD-dependent oxidoreductase n=1 Tax=Kitasatospora sp. NE20-6 TaxID=2859066 RepID=UPI0038B3891C